MAKAFINEKNFNLGDGIGICDFCNTPSSKGYYISVLNSWYCEDCYNEWVDRNFEKYKDILGIN